MSTFAYTARTTSGQSISGTIAAASLAEAMRLIRGEGKYPTAIRPAEESSQGVSADKARGGQRVGRADVIHLITQLTIMIETGVSLGEALDCIGKQMDKPAVKALVSDVSEQVQAGTSLSDAMSRHPRSFPQLLIALVRASEKSGTMGRLLGRATSYLRDEQEIVRKVKGALSYPLLMLCFAVAVTVFLLTCIMPRFVAIYASKNAVLPTPTRILMNISDLLVGHYILASGGTVGLAVGLLLALRTRWGRRGWHYVQLHLPLVGRIYRKLHLSRGLRMIGTMAGAGVSLVECVATAEGLCANTYFRDLWKRAGDYIQSGRQMSDPLFESPLVPRSVAQMVFAGEKAGRLAAVLEQVSVYAEQELKEEIGNLTRYIEPLMIIVMGSIIGGVCMALLLPIFSISKVMAQ